MERVKLAVIGGGGFRVPLLVKALAGSPFEVHLYDDDPARLSVIRNVIAGMGLPHPTFHGSADAPAGAQNHSSRNAAASAGHVTPDQALAAALSNADFVFTAIRVGGPDGRALDERIAQRHGFLGQETVGLGGMAYALRTIPEARRIAAAIAAHAPNAWTINFTNPAGVVTQAMQEVLGDRAIGICDTPISLVHRVAGNAPLDSIDYVGLNHLGWLRSATSNGRNLVQELLADDDALPRLEEAQVFGPDVLRSIGALPNEYLFYYWFTREAIERIGQRDGRGAYLAAQQRAFYEAASAAPEHAAALWREALADREETYGAEAREDATSRRTEEEIAGGGYQEVALTLMAALAGGAPALTISNVRNDLGGTRAIAQLPGSAVVEIPCRVDGTGIHPLPIAPVSPEMAGLMVQVKASDELLLAATRHRDPALAARALAAHPLIDSLGAGRAALVDYCAEVPAIAAAVGWRPEKRVR